MSASARCWPADRRTFPKDSPVSSRSLIFCLCALLLFAAHQTAAKTLGLSAADLRDVEKAETYLNEIKSVRAHFLQVAAAGGSAEGMLYLSRPGKLRMDYDDPSPIVIVTSGAFLVYHDRKLLQTTYIDLDSTLAGVLVKPNIRLNAGELKVTGVSHETGVLSIVVTKSDGDAMGRVTLVFSETPFALKQWHILDPQGQTTSISLFDVKQDVKIDPELFRFKDPAFFKGDQNSR